MCHICLPITDTECCSMGIRVISLSFPKRCMPLSIGLLPQISYPHSLMSCFRTKLSKALITDPAKIEWRSAADLKIRYGTTLRLGVVRYSTLLTVEGA